MTVPLVQDPLGPDRNFWAGRLGSFVWIHLLHVVAQARAALRSVGATSSVSGKRWPLRDKKSCEERI